MWCATQSYYEKNVVLGKSKQVKRRFQISAKVCTLKHTFICKIINATFMLLKGQNNQCHFHVVERIMQRFPFGITIIEH